MRQELIDLIKTLKIYIPEKKKHQPIELRLRQYDKLAVCYVYRYSNPVDVADDILEQWNQ